MRQKLERLVMFFYGCMRMQGLVLYELHMPELYSIFYLSSNCNLLNNNNNVYHTGDSVQVFMSIL
jgi:hypothetical protein